MIVSEIKKHFFLIYWAFYKSTIFINFVVSLMVGLVTMSITIFAISLATIGLIFALLYKEVMCPYEYYFYYNRGISKIRLIVFCLFVNSLPSTLILIILQLCRICLK